MSIAQQQQAVIDTQKEWFVLKGEQKYGPYLYTDIINMMQKKAIFDFDFIWAEGMRAWTPISDIVDFSSDRLRELSGNLEEQSVFMKRQHTRAHTSKLLYAHNDNFLWNGRTLTVSEKGALILLETPSLLPGQLLTLHFKQNQKGEEAFNVRAEIVAKKNIREKISLSSCLRYAVRFLKVNSPGDELLKKWVQASDIKENNKR